MVPQRLNPNEKTGRDIREMFAGIAPRYDLLNRVLSAGLDRRWRRVAVETSLEGTSGEVEVLDVCCGTGDLATEFAKHPRVRRVVGIDFAEPMVQIAKEKVKQEQDRGWAVGDALGLPVADASFDVISIAFGLRNLVDPVAGLREFARILRPGGRLVILEFFPPPSGVIQKSFRLYFHHVLPRLGRWISGRQRVDAYRYLPDSVEAFARPGEVESWMDAAGLRAIGTKELTFKMVAVLGAEKKASTRRASPDLAAAAAG